MLCYKQDCHARFQVGLPSTKQPAGSLCTDGKRLDGLTNMSWQAGKTAVWDVTVANTLAGSYLASSLMTVAAAAELNCYHKNRSKIC